MSAAARKVLVIAGLGKGSGTGGSTARIFSKAGYSIALIARGKASVDQLAQEINAAGGEATGFAIESYSAQDVTNAWTAIRTKYPAPTYTIGAAVYNAAHGVWKPFLDVTPADIRDSVNVNVEAAFAFAREAILTFKGNKAAESTGAKGTLIFTGATASLRGNVTTSAFSAGKHGLRALSQSLNKEFGKEDIHVSHVIIDGVIRTERTGNIATRTDDIRLDPDSIATTYLYLVNQGRSAWTWELDLRPSQERW